MSFEEALYTHSVGCPILYRSAKVVEYRGRTPESAAQVPEQITAMIRKELPALTKVYNEALKKESDKQGTKKNPQKEMLSTEERKKAT